MKRIIPLAILAAVIVGAYYFIFSKPNFDKRNSASPGVTAVEDKYTASVTDKDVQQAVFYALPDHIFKPQNGGKVFCSEKIYGYNADSVNMKINTYLFANCEEYYIKNNVPTLGFTLSVPVEVVFSTTKQSLTYDSIKIPEGGSNFQGSLKTFFPDKYFQKAQEVIDINSLVPSPKTQADNYYQGKLEVYF